MGLIDISWGNIRRRLGKTLLLVMGLTIGVTTVVALQAITRTMKDDVGMKLDEFGANILVVPRSESLSLSYGGLTVSSAAYDVGELTVGDAERILTIPNARNVSVIAPKLLSAVEIKGQPVLVAGVDFASELRLKQWWEVVGKEPQSDDGAIVGSRVASLLDLSAGSQVHVGDRAFEIVAVLAENGQQDDDTLFISLDAAQRALNRPNAISLIEVAALCTACPIEKMVEQIQQVLPQARVTALRQAVTLRMETVGQISRFAWALSGVVTVIGGLVVLTTMLGAVTERRREIGVFRAIGFRRAHIMRVILAESALVSLLGGFLGWLIGMGAATLLAPGVAEISIAVRWDPWLALSAVSVAVLVGLLCSLYPAVRASRLDPTTALRAL
ncbi:MAG: ABC transporter permease [Anaerolineae bacterium]|jgi:putative ABC transport system permease protein